MTLTTAQRMALDSAARNEGVIVQETTPGGVIRALAQAELIRGTRMTAKGYTALQEPAPVYGAIKAKVLDAVAKNPTATRDEIATLAGVERHQAVNALHNISTRSVRAAARAAAPKPEKRKPKPRTRTRDGKIPYAGAE